MSCYCCWGYHQSLFLGQSQQFPSSYNLPCFWLFSIMCLIVFYPINKTKKHLWYTSSWTPADFRLHSLQVTSGLSNEQEPFLHRPPETNHRLAFVQNGGPNCDRCFLHLRGGSQLIHDLKAICETIHLEASLVCSPQKNKKKHGVVVCTRPQKL